MACWARLAEMRIVSTNYDYSFSKHDGNMSEEWWKTEITPYVDAARQSARLLLAEVGVNEESEDFPFLYVHEAYRHLARITDFVYTKIDRRKRGDTL